MTTYAKDFSDELTTGVFASDFTNRFKTTSGWTIEAPTDAEDDRTFQAAGTDTDSSLGLVSWDDVDGDANRVNSDIVVRFKCASDAANEWWIWTRASGSAGSENGYVCFCNAGGNIVMSRYDSGTQSVLTAADEDLNADFVSNPWAYFTDDQDPSFTYQPADLWLYVRFRVNGTGATVTLQTKVWIDGVQGLGNEPDHWINETTDTSGSRISTAGWCGIGRFGETGVVDWDYIAIGTNGDTAPINASTNTTVRVSTAFIEVMGQQANPEVQMTQQFVNVLGQDSAPEVRLSSMYAKVLHKRVIATGNDVSGQLIITSG